jgi:hypothetical protein
MNGANDEVVIHDDSWNNIDGEGGALATIDEEAFFSVSNIPAGGAWRDIEVWTGEAGGGDGGVLYMARDASPDADNWPLAGFSAAQQAEYRMSNDILRVMLPGEILSGTAMATLTDGRIYDFEVDSKLLRTSGKIFVADPGGAAVTQLDLNGAIIRVAEDGELVAGDEWVLFAADELLNEDSVTFVFDDPTKWDVSGLSVDGLGGHRIRYIGDSVSFDCNGDGVVDVLDANCATVETLDATLAAANLIKGDANGNGEVQFEDFVTLSNTFGNPGQYTEGDFDKDGTVQFPDFVILANNFGLVSGGAAAAAVPEPSGVALLAIAGLLLGWARRRRR